MEETYISYIPFGCVSQGVYQTLKQDSVVFFWLLLLLLLLLLRSENELTKVLLFSEFLSHRLPIFLSFRSLNMNWIAYKVGIGKRNGVDD